MKSKDFDDFSFKAPTESEQSIGQISQKDQQPNKKQQFIPKDIHYRHLEANTKKPIQIFDMEINKKINDISQQLQLNIQRRLQLQKKLNIVQKDQKKKQQIGMFLAYNSNTYKTHEQQGKQFDKMNQKVDKIDQMIKQNNTKKGDGKQKLIQKNKQILLDFQSPILQQKQQILIPIIQKISTKNKPIPVYTLPDQIKIQNLLQKVTFPQLPKGNLQQLRKQIQNLFTVHSPHSDIHYLLMIIYFHLQKFMKVRKNFEEIINFKTFNVKSYWIAAQAQFQMQNYDLCLKLTQDCMNKIEQKYLPRFIYLKAKSYDQTGNYVNSVVCFNQLIKMKPKISEYYFERGIIYHRIGYYREAKQDFVTFGILKPEAQNFIKEKVLIQKNEHKKRQYIALLAKMF